jgi:hypothetical protein
MHTELNNLLTLRNATKQDHKPSHKLAANTYQTKHSMAISLTSSRNNAKPRTSLCHPTLAPRTIFRNTANLVTGSGGTRTVDVNFR